MAAAELSSITWDTPTFDIIVNKALNWTTVIGVFLASTFLSLKLGYEYFKYSMGAAQGNDVNVVWDWQEMSRVFVIITLIGCYTPLATGVTKAMSEINSITQADSAINDKLEHAANVWYVKNHNAIEYDMLIKLKQQYADAKAKGDSKKMEVLDSEIKKMRSEAFENADGSVEGSTSTTEEKEDASFWSAINPARFFENALIGLTAIIADAIKLIVGMFVKTIFKVGICFGPIVLAFGVFFKEKPISYLNQMLTLGMVFTTLNILDLLFLYFFDQYVTTDVGVGESLAINLSMIGCYLSVMKITSMFIGQIGMNSMMNRGMGAATMIVAGAVAGVGKAAASGKGGGSASGGSGGSGSSIAQTVQKANQISSSGKERAD